jgi:deoxyribodipyrimidine photo-lyase
MSYLILFWHRRDLRISDNVGLAAAREQSPKVVGVFCLDPNILDGDDIAPARVKYMIGCLQELQQRYQQAGSQLLILKGEPSKLIPNLAAALKAKAVFWNLDVEPYAKKRDEKVTEALKQKSIEIENYWDQLLHSPGKLLTKSKEPYKVYTPFWRSWIKLSKNSPAPTLENMEGLTDKEITAAKQVGIIDLPTAKDLGYIWENELILTPGELAAQKRLEEFCDRSVEEYKIQRDFPAIDATSKLSAALKFGAIGIRTIWQAATQVYENSRSDESRENIEAWQQELAWREFYQHCMHFFPELAEEAYRHEFKDFPWDNNQEYFQAWCEGKTGYPIVDAAMRQLNEIGWMHNRCRMIVASFLTKDLIIDWRWGEKYFMQKLYDGDKSANNGGWQWSASSGIDPKPLRIFNPSTQAQKYDPEGEYIRQWMPELSSIDNEYLVTGNIPKDERDRCGYPSPIVDHKKQQQEFKRRYSAQKN